ncbi:MAG: MAPEG family protein [Rhodospirillaceae bacterium]|nr:MAPEG family protein [Rhodospirillaceae bacterium]
MTMALWCVLAGGLMPYVFATVAKVGAPIDNRLPRDSADALIGFRRRAFAAHLNTFESFPFFAIAVLAAQTQGGSQTQIDQLAMVWVGLRLVYFALYLGNLAALRSLVWAIGVVVAVAIFTVPVWA